MLWPVTIWRFFGQKSTDRALGCVGLKRLCAERKSTVCHKNKTLCMRLVPMTTISWQRLLYYQHCFIVFLSFFCLKSFLLLWASNEDAFPHTLFGWWAEYYINNGPAITTPENRHRARRMWVHDRNKYKHTNELLTVFYWRTYRTASGTQRWPTPASPQFLSIDQSITHWNNNTTQPSSASWKECQWHHRWFSEMSGNFKLWSALEELKVASQKWQRAPVRGRCTFLSMQEPAAAHALSSLRTIQKRRRRSEKNARWTQVLTLPRI